MFDLVTALKAAGETTRLRILALLRQGELTVSEIIQVLDQSQPRVSRHLRLLAEAGLIERFQEGTWVFCRLADRGEKGALVRTLLNFLPAESSDFARDRKALKRVRAARSDEAAAYFRAIADSWNEVRSLYVSEEEVEAHLMRALEEIDIADLLDIGTGTGRMLQLFAGRVERGTGVDLSQEMLAIARATLDREGLTNCQARQADMYDLPFDAASQDAVIIHQVLHYADDPERVIAEAARVLRPGGHVLVADFAPHAEEHLRDEHAHRRLGFRDDEVLGWAGAAGLAGRAVEHLGGDPLTVSIWNLEKAGNTQ